MLEAAWKQVGRYKKASGVDGVRPHSERLLGERALAMLSLDRAIGLTSTRALRDYLLKQRAEIVRA